MASGGLSVVTPPRISESSPNYKIDNKYNTSKSHVMRQSKTQSEKVMTSQDSSQSQPQQQCNKRSYSVSYKIYDSQIMTRKRSEFNYKRRRYSVGNNSDSKYNNKKRGKNAIVLPTKFLLGGNINDPLNLSSLANDVNQVTPQSSPLPTPKHRTQVEVLIPTNINDPLNLNSNEDIDESSLISPKTKGKSRKRKRKRTDSETTADGEVEGINVSVINDNEIKKCVDNTNKFQKLRFNETKTLVDKIVSPVIPQGGPSCGKHRRFITDNQKGNSETEISSHNKDFKVKYKKYNKNKSKSKGPHFRPKDLKFRYGNYNRYYGYRNTHQTDARFDTLKREWFEHKDVLDIGCNVGHITLAIAKNFEPNKIIGLDIDLELIKIARKNVRHYITTDVMLKEEFPISLPLLHGPLASTVTSVSNIDNNSLSNVLFPNNVFFVEGNYVLESDDLLNVQKQEFDCILCLSLTKWIHLNWGDIGLKRLFKRIFSQLRPGGKLVLEAQPWCSYKKKKNINVSLMLLKFSKFFLSMSRNHNQKNLKF
jgi:7SK snRNA methylphosphate capping enzyme